MTSGLTAGPFDDVVASEASLKRFLHGLPGVDQVGAENRVARLAPRGALPSVVDQRRLRGRISLGVARETSHTIAPKVR